MEPTARSIARTYSDRVYPDPWEKVEDYQRVQAYAAEHPNAGRTAVGNALELPPARVRGWLNGGKPDPVRGIETASANGWLDPDCDMAGALVELLAHILAGGSINETFVPAISTGRRIDHATIEEAFAAVGVGTNERHAESDGRATELYPATDASVLGRCLVAMGAPHGAKTALDAVPTIVWESPESIRRRFVEVYVAHRGAHFETKATTRIQEERPASYLEDLHNLIGETVDGNVSVGDRAVTISADAARELGLS
ncbi:hypothetical protein C471_08580 [Halorubrum saccharovorum DSM 1137]|uniref:Uncharacterized protein n=1 Tax=Halorubrum saccharovorum DSM 1137 TaxID=1227484 RepID=M0DUY9_9EURY|nr:hypothetical protein [Halorubrum saccharovorum]ELZ39321.1 hypothetical protein C471_08580 [Halorubrum saccharovorum DSM 1137]